MSASEIAAAMSGARKYLTANPAEGRYRDGAATASIEAGLRDERLELGVGFKA